MGVRKRTHNAPTQNQGRIGIDFLSRSGLLPPLKPGIPRGRDANEARAGLQGRHPVGPLDPEEPGIGFPSAISSLPVEVMP